MAVESGPRNRETWAGISRCLYLQLADKKPNVGRIQHHLAVPTRPDMLKQLFYYTKSLVSVHPFPNAGESIQFLFHPLLNELKPGNQPIVASAFVSAHGKLFTQRPLSDFKTLMNEYLNEYISGRGSAFKMCGVFIASCNFAAIFQYGSTDAVLPNEFKESLAQDETSLTASKNWTQLRLSFASIRTRNPNQNWSTMVLISPSRLSLSYWIILTMRMSFQLCTPTWLLSGA